MSTAKPLDAGTQAFLTHYAEQAPRLPGDPAIREAAARAFAAAGLPGRRDEAWKYTDLRRLRETRFDGMPGGVAPDDARLAAIAAPRIVFVDGHFRRDLSVLPQAATVTDFAAAPIFGGLAQPEREPLAALNTMLAEDGALIVVPDGVDAGTIVLVNLVASPDVGPGVAVHLRHGVRLGRDARLALIEIAQGSGQYLHNSVAEIAVGEGARLVHVRLQDEARTACHVATLYVDVLAGGAYDAFTLGLGAALARTEIHARLGGAGAGARLNGAQLLREAQHGDITAVVAHDAPCCASRQTVKSVLQGRSRGVFQGRIEVARGAQKTDGYQMNQALLLSPEAEIDCKPELAIFADDVKCSHAATIGALDPEQIFYLQSRGIPETTARGMLVRAFLAEALDAVEHASGRALLEDAVARWWEEEAA